MPAKKQVKAAAPAKKAPVKAAPAKKQQAKAAAPVKKAAAPKAAAPAKQAKQVKKPKTSPEELKKLRNQVRKYYKKVHIVKRLAFMKSYGVTLNKMEEAKLAKAETFKKELEAARKRYHEAF